MQKNQEVPSRLLGVLGGMGPLATVDFLGKLVAETPGRRDADHVPVVVYSVPQIPSRPQAILAGGPSPLPAMLAGMRTLREAGAQIIAMPCNTAHYWYDELTREGGVPIIHIADATAAEIAALGAPGIVGILGTDATVAVRLFEKRLEPCGLRCIAPSARELEELVLPAIECVKRHDLETGHRLALRACESLRRAGAEAIVLGCTELPVAVEYSPSDIAAHCVDPTRALARACVRWWHQVQPHADVSRR